MFQVHYAKWTHIQNTVDYMIAYMIFWKSQNNGDINISVVAWGFWLGEGIYCNEAQGNSEVMEIVMFGVVFIQRYAFVKTHRSVH